MVISRRAREKSPEYMYHIMCRSIPELQLFKDDDDKEYYLSLLEKYIKKFNCKLYAYCLMSNHVHLQLDPAGFDISKLMLCINTAYACYFNRKHKRYGHVFQDRFHSKVLDKESYIFAVSAYIHNNPCDIEGYSGREETYPYSSYGIYLGLKKDTRNLIDKSFMMGLFNTDNEKEFARRYMEFVTHQRDKGGIAEIAELLTNTDYQYVSGRRIILRDKPPAKIINMIANSLNFNITSDLITKSRKTNHYRAFTAYVLRVLCGLSYREICEKICNITISGCANLCMKGYELLSSEPSYTAIFENLLTYN